MEKRRLTLLAIGLIAPLVASVGCGSSSGTTSSTVFSVAYPTDPGSLDPLHYVEATSAQIIQYAYEGLTTPDNGKLAPLLATKWTETPTSVTFTLRDDITCHDGSKLTAQDVADEFTYIADPANSATQLGAQITAGTTAVADSAANTVTVTAPSPDGFLAWKASSVPIVCAAGLKDLDGLATKTNGTGLYALTEAASGDHYTFTKRSGYTWGSNGTTSDTPGLPSAITVRIIPNETTVANLLASGELNAGVVTGADRSRLAGPEFKQYASIQPTGSTVFNQNTNRPTNDIRVRRALMLALDFATVGKVLTDGEGQPSTALTTLAPNPCRPKTAPWTLPEQDVAKAEALLDQAGWKLVGDRREKDGKPLDLTFLYESNLGSSTGSAAELVSQEWEKLGITANIQEVSGATETTVLFQSFEWDVAWAAVKSAMPSIMVPYYSGAAPPNGMNYIFNTNQRYATLTAEATALTPEQGGCAKWQAADAALVDNYDVVPIIDGKAVTFARGATFDMIPDIIPTSIRLG